MGSRNCGPCLELGVRTEVNVKPSGKTRIEIKINGKNSPAETTHAVVKQLLKFTEEALEIKINHICHVLVGAGFGASGAGALGAAMALIKALGLKLPHHAPVTTAHVAEVTCRTGLGDVVAQAVGGLVIGERPGAPPFGERKRIPAPGDVQVVCCTLGPLKTSRLLRDPEFRLKSKALGKMAMNEMLKAPTFKNFLKISNEFSEQLGLLDDDLCSLMNAAGKAGALGSGQAMLGRSVFSLVKKRDVEKVRKSFVEISAPDAVIVSGISKSGGRFL
jgi:pantoate kinase